MAYISTRKLEQQVWLHEQKAAQARAALRLIRSLKTKYNCPGCGVNAWADPGVSLLCGKCSVQLEAEAGFAVVGWGEERSEDDEAHRTTAYLPDPPHRG